MNGKKKRHVILIVLAVVVLAAGILGGRELWLYEHPEIQIRFSHDRSEDLYRSYPICSIRSRSHIGQGMRSSMVRNCGSIGKQPMRFLCGSVNSIRNRYMSLRM